MKLSKRLQAAADYVEFKDKTLDIGCDHGYLDIYLALNKKNKLIIASDISDTVIKSTINNFNKFKVNQLIKTYCTNGTADIKDNYDTIIITGLGSYTIMEILSNAKKVDKLIISSNNNWSLIRKDISKLGYTLHEETLVYEKKKLYSVMLFKKGKGSIPKKEIRVGKYNIKNKNLYKILFDESLRIYKKIPLKELGKKVYYYKIIRDLNSYLRKKDREIV